VDTNLVTAVRPVHQNCSPLARDCLACHLRQVWLLTRPWLPPLQGRDDIHTTSLLGLLAAALGRLVCERAQAAGQSAVRVGCPARGRVCLLARWPSCRQLLEQQLHASCDGLPGAHQLVRVLGRVQACAARPSLCSRPGSLRCPTRHASAPRQPAPARQQPHAGCGSLPRAPCRPRRTLVARPGLPPAAGTRHATRAPSSAKLTNAWRARYSAPAAAGTTVCCATPSVPPPTESSTA